MGLIASLPSQTCLNQEPWLVESIPPALAAPRTKRLHFSLEICDGHQTMCFGHFQLFKYETLELLTPAPTLLLRSEVRAADADVASEVLEVHGTVAFQVMLTDPHDDIGVAGLEQR